MQRAILDPLRAALVTRSDLRLALLFGSHARGHARPNSDVDVALDAPGVDLLALAVGSSKQSPGNSYLDDGLSGAQRWPCPAPLMNWPMVITPSGTVALGAATTGRSTTGT